MTPTSITRDGVPAEMLQKERELLTEVARKEGKPEAILQKMVEGRLGKFFEEHCLLDQKFILDDKVTVKAALAAVSKSVGSTVRIADFAYMKVGQDAAV